MNHTIKAKLLGSDKTVTFEANAIGCCPLCHATYYPNLQYAFCVPNENSTAENPFKIFALYFCPNCQMSFITTYYCSNYNSKNTNIAKNPSTAPIKTETPIINDRLQNISPNFYKMYCQAYQADAENLTELAGIGYRCALEFLIKDFLSVPCANDTESVNSIRKMSLSDAINKLDNDRMKNVARSIAWIGNDYAHYITKHPEKDIDDLKRFFHIAIEYVLTEIYIDEADDFINNSK